MIILTVILIAADQILKIWVKTHMPLTESITVFANWFQLRFVENNGAAFGMQLSTGDGFDWGKLLLSLFRLGMIGALIWYIRYLVKQNAPVKIILPMAMILAGAVGNMIDSCFYGLIFSESTFTTPAHFGGHYAGFMMGRVVDMFYFPLFQWNSVPGFLSFLFDSDNYFFGAIFNLADAYISVAVVLLAFNWKYFK